MQELTGKTAVITGAASGMGLAFARRFAAAGMHVVMADIEEPALINAADDVAEHAQTNGASIETMTSVTDVSDRDAVHALAAASIERFGQVNVLCNNAGVAGSGLTSSPADIDVANWKWVIDVNMWGVIYGHEAFLPHMLEHGDGHVVNTASMAGHLPGNSAYSASKWAVVGITEGLHHQLAGSTVGISCLCPGWVRTQIAESDRNRPEWASPSALREPSAESEERMAFIRELLASGLDPEAVADLVHDAVLEQRFWIFTHPEMVEALQPRYDSILNGTNPPPTFGSLLDD